MKKTLLVGAVLVCVVVFAGVASAANHIGVGYYFQGDHRGLTLKGELALTDMIDVGLDYFGIEGGSWTDIYASMNLKEFGDTLVGAYGGARLHTSSLTKPELLLGVWAEQPLSSQFLLYGDAGVAIGLGSGHVGSTSFEAVAGLMADVYAPFWLAGEAILKSGNSGGPIGFRVLVGMDF
ncbi:MAG: hypothetical protein GX969_03400 [Firmicutes bacterium]|nr:hypothetical protein [Bacillota bacterium]